MKDIESFWHSSEKLRTALAPPRGNLQAWETFLLENPVMVRTEVKQALKASSDDPVPALASPAPAAPSAIGHEASGVEAPPEVAALLAGVFVCPECGEQGLSGDRLKSHRTRRHGYRNQARLYISGSVCPSCMKGFHKRPRALHHAMYSRKVCFAMALQNRTPMGADEARELDAADAAAARALRKSGLTAWQNEAPAFRRQGPLPRPHGVALRPWFPSGEDPA